MTRFACGSGATSRPALALAALLAATGGCAHDPPPLPAEAAWAATPEGDRYLALVRRELHAKYVVPQRVRDRGARLKAALLLFIEPDGRVATWRFEARSGDAEFDAALDEAVQRVRLPPPPEAGRENLRSKGLGVVFRLQPP